MKVDTYTFALVLMMILFVLALPFAIINDNKEADKCEALGGKWASRISLCLDKSIIIKGE